MLKTELATKIREAMKEKGILSYKELYKKSNVEITEHFSKVLNGERTMPEKELLKILETLEIPKEFLEGKVEKQIRYRIIDLEPVAQNDEEKIKELNYSKDRKEYQRLYKRMWREKNKERVYEKEKEYARERYRNKKKVGD